MSRLYQVLSEPDGGRVAVRDLDGGTSVVSMLAFEGPPPRPGQWVVAHSGFALCAAAAEDVEVALSEWRRADRRRT